MSNETPAAADAWTTVAILTRPRGNRGELTAFSLSSKPERFIELRSVHLFGSGAAFEVERVWDHEGTLVFKFRGIDSISDAEKLRGAEVRVPKSQRVELEAGRVFSCGSGGLRSAGSALPAG